MTDPLPPDDELVSAHLDGEATPEEASAVNASPAAQARRAELDAVRAAVGEPAVPPAGASAEGEPSIL
jgi:anti-sigma factor RsiW